MDARGADVDAGVLVLTGGKDKGVGDFLGRPTGLFFIVKRSIRTYLLKNLGHWASLILKGSSLLLALSNKEVNAKLEAHVYEYPKRIIKVICSTNFLNIYLISKWGPNF